MPTTRTYGDACALARALDVVGERWSLLVVRELLFGPQRFSDLRHALPNASSNMITDRLRELENRGVIRRRKLPPPAGSSVYELTDRGQKLEPTVLALGEWGAPIPSPPQPTLSATSVLLFLRGLVHLDPTTPPAVYGIELDERMWTVQTTNGHVEVHQGEPNNAGVVLRTDPKTLNGLLTEPHTLNRALSQSTITVEGDVALLRRLLDAAAAAVPA